MTQSVLLTLGRLPKGLDIARSFHRAGWRVIIADPARDHLARASNHVAKTYRVPPPATERGPYLNALRDIINREAINLVVPISEEIMYLSLLADDVDFKPLILSMTSDLIHRTHDKGAFIELCQKINLTVPETARSDSDDALNIARSGAFIIKPIHSCAGDSVSLHEQGATFPAESDRLVQRRVIGAEVSTCSLARNGKRQATSIYRGTLMGGTVAVGFERIEIEAIEHWVDHFIQSTKWTGFISFDFIIDQAGTPYAIECNPRTTSGLHFFETEDLAHAILDDTHMIRFRPERRMMQFWSCMEELQKGFGNAQKTRAALQHLILHRDVTWALRDPLPLLTMPWTARDIIKAAHRDGVPFGIAATRDLVWTGTGETVHDPARSV
jgi:predicted ATP-grasp superfamily ATP-dependent carboligase